MTTPPSREADRPRRLVVAFVLLAVLLLALSEAVSLWLGRDRALDEARRRADNLALILAEHAARTVSAIDATLRHLAIHGQRIGGGAASREAWTPILQSARAGLTGVGALTVVDADGLIRDSTAPVVVGQSRRGNFLYQRLESDPAAGLVADTPFRGQVGGGMLIPLGRRLARPDGAFDGIAVATLVPEQLRDFYRSVDVGRGGAIWVMHPSGVLLFREPSNGDPIGVSVAGHPLFLAPLRDAAGRHHGPLVADGPAQISAVRGLDQPPLRLAVSLDEDEVLAPWRQQAAQSIGLTLAVAAILILIGAALVRQLGARARVERSLARRERELHRAQDIASTGSIHVDLPAMTATLSPTASRILGLDGDGRVPFDMVVDRLAEDERAGLRAAIQRCAEAGDAFELEFRVARAGREVSICRSEGNLVVESPGERYVLAVLQDITERRRTEELLRQSQRLEAIGHLTGGVAHDFNNLLTVILGQAEDLTDRLADDRVLGGRAQAILSAAERGAELTRRLLAFARRQPLAPRTVDINQLVGGVEGLLRQMLGEQVEVELVRGAGLWRAVVDPAQLENALLNLAVNARDAMPDGGRLTIETANSQIDDDYAARHGDVSPGRYVQISVADTGAGMPPEVINRAFEPFFTTKEAGKGTGLGLSTVHGFVKQSGGHIKIYSELGHGTILRIYLPRSAEDLAEAGPVAAPPAAEPRGDETILVVEDDEQVREHTVELLRTLGYRVVAAPDGPRALAALRATPDIRLMFTDMVMPGGLNGRELADQARAIRPDLRILFTSGYTETSSLHHGRLDVGVQLLSKPYRRPELASKIRLALDSA